MARLSAIVMMACAAATTAFVVAPARPMRAISPSATRVLDDPVAFFGNKAQDAKTAQKGAKVAAKKANSAANAAQKAAAAKKIAADKAAAAKKVQAKKLAAKKAAEKAAAAKKQAALKAQQQKKQAAQISSKRKQQKGAGKGGGFSLSSLYGGVDLFGE
jgi:membrane protein involved in colicin uptake